MFWSSSWIFLHPRLNCYWWDKLLKASSPSCWLLISNFFLRLFTISHTYLVKTKFCNSPLPFFSYWLACAPQVHAFFFLLTPLNCNLGTSKRPGDRRNLLAHFPAKSKLSRHKPRKWTVETSIRLIVYGKLPPPSNWSWGEWKWVSQSTFLIERSLWGRERDVLIFSFPIELSVS